MIPRPADRWLSRNGPFCLLVDGPLFLSRARRGSGVASGDDGWAGSVSPWRDDDERLLMSREMKAGCAGRHAYD